MSPKVRPRIRRSTHDRYIAGVCGGVGRATDVDPVIYRVVLAVLTLFGGIGVLLYALGWLLLPAEDEEQSEAQKLMSGQGRSSSVLPLVGLAVSTILVIAFITAGSDIAIVVIIAFVVLAVVLSKQRQDSRTTARTDEVTGASSPPLAGTAPAGMAAAPPPAPPPDLYRLPPSFAGKYPPGAHPSVPPSTVATGPTGSGFGAPWPGAEPYLPEARAPGGAGARNQRERQGSWLGFATLGLAAVVGGILVAADVPSDDSGVPLIVAAVLVVIGIGLLVGTWVGRSRGLIVWGIVSTLVLVTVATYDVPLRGGVGEARWTPTSVTAAQAEPYRLLAGEAMLDLSELPPAPGTTTDVEASVTTGRLVVDVPADVAIHVQVHVGLGHLAVLTDSGTRIDRGGFNLTADYTDVGEAVPETGRQDDSGTPVESSAGTIHLDLDVGVGELEVRRAPASR